MKTLGSSIRLATSIAGLFLVVLAAPAAADTCPTGPPPTYVYGTISANTTWLLVCSPYIATGDIRVQGGATPVLTIEPGVTVKFDQGVTLYVAQVNLGGLQAVGTSQAPITFTANTASPTPGYWKGIQLYASTTPTTRISYATVSYGGVNNTWGGIYVQGCSPTISYVTSSNNAHSGIAIDGGSPSISYSTISSNPYGIITWNLATPSVQTLTISNNTAFAISQDANQTFAAISGLTMTGNGTNGVELRSVTVAVNTTWKSGGSPYIATGDIRVQGGSTPVLTVQAGVTVKFNQGVTFYVAQVNLGGLQAVGTSQAPITFTANTASPTPGYWKGIQLYASTTPATRISYATVSYGGLNGQWGGIYVQGCSPTLSNVTLSNNAYAGLSIRSGFPIIVSSTFASNPAGIINLTPTVGLPVNALLNYWGSATGPSGIGPGTGQSVSAGVLFNPWLTAAPVAPEYLSSGTDSNLHFNPSTGQAIWSLTASQFSTWTLTISNSLHNVVRTITGSGVAFNPAWNGRNDLGVLQPDGNYSYTLQARSIQGTASPAAGTLFVDSLFSVVLTSPTNGQTLSNVYTNGLTDLPVTGSANMTGLSVWRLNYGVGGAPSTWIQLASGTQGVTNGTFATWPTLSIPNQLYTLWLSAWDVSGYYSQFTISVTVANFSASENALQLSAPASNTVTYTSIVPFALTETLVVKNAAGQVVRTLVNAAPRPANTYNDVWDGKSDSAGFLPDGPYFYFATVTDGPHIFTWDLTNQYYNDWFRAQQPSLSYWDPFNNRPLVFSYYFSVPSRITVAFMHNEGDHCSPPNFCPEQEKYEEAGTHPFAWAGVDGTGALRYDLNKLVVLSSRATFSKNAIVLFGTKPQILSVTVTPPMYGPAVGTQDVNFDLAVMQGLTATVTVTFLNQDSLSVLRTITLTGQTSGHKTVTWDGHADNGMWVAAGFYTVTVMAVDPLGNQVQGQILTTIQY